MSFRYGSGNRWSKRASAKDFEKKADWELVDRNEQNGAQRWSPPRRMWFVGVVPANVGSPWPTCGKRYVCADADSQRTSCWQQAWQEPKWKDSPPLTKLMQSGQLPSANEQDKKRTATGSSGINPDFARTQKSPRLPAARSSNLRTSRSTLPRSTSASPRSNFSRSWLQPSEWLA